MWSPPSALAPALAPPAAAASARVSDLREIPVRSGVNVVRRLAPDGRDGVIVEGAPNVEVADQTHTDVMVLIRPARPGDAWEVARVARWSGPGAAEAAAADVVSDYPHTGEDQVSSIRFARGRVDGAPAVLMIRARRDFVLPIPDPSPVTIDIFRLVITRDFGEALFRRVSRRRYPGCFSNTDVALKTLLGLPEPAGVYAAGGREPCPPSHR